MTRTSFPASQHFFFEMELAVSSALGLSSGELAMLLSDGLSALDDRGLLFPGITTPDRGDRLLGVKIGAIGYERFGRTGRSVRARHVQGEQAGTRGGSGRERGTASPAGASDRAG